MDDVRKTKQQLIAELDELRRRAADLKAAAVDHRQAAQRLAKDARVSEAALRQSEATGQALLESASEGILLIDSSGRITLVNAAAERMFGFDRDELRHIIEFIRSGGLDRARQIEQEKLAEQVRQLQTRDARGASSSLFSSVSGG